MIKLHKHLIRIYSLIFAVFFLFAISILAQETLVFESGNARKHDNHSISNTIMRGIYFRLYQRNIIEIG